MSTTKTDASTPSHASDPFHDLVLYKKDSCPYCVKVMQALHGWGVQLTQRDIDQEAAARATLLQVGGKAQVPCLFIDGQPLYESEAILAYVRQRLPSPQARG